MAEGIYGRKCPKCGYINDRDAMVCAKGCSGGLRRISPQHHKQEEIQQDNATETSTSQNMQPQVPPQALNRHKETVRLELLSPRLCCEANPNFAVEIRDGDVIGREGHIDVTQLSKSEYISRKHAMFIQQGNNWSLKVESNTNPTTVNFKRLNPGETVPLKDNDRITLADTTFIFRMS